MTSRSAGSERPKAEPPQSAPPLTPGARRILDTAAELFYERGITATGVDTVAEAAQITKRTLYNRFGSKDALVTAYLRERDERWRALVTEAVEERAPGLPRLLAPFDVLTSWTASNSRGCAFVNALAELPDPAHPAHRVAAEEKKWLRALFVRLLGESGLKGRERGELADQLVCLHEGALVLHSLRPGPAALRPARAGARTLLRAKGIGAG
ncbi:TetR/AcrR family transcriptional regulator [Streptomyces nanshensis]|uniref:HTH tetR-type domain-containing protein n=1 Tax=Streptomyces nanshensis TaxID=518642 RepID=A0A1E7KH19_9ACTN|nr:TetR/AcrR family transcriptional regulator [Streptomyces nanshensis]OEV03240.1 hypothetical protein AN218_32660 [Streptomyces nanshensis]